MIGPLRRQLALWHTASLALLLVLFAATTYLYFARYSLRNIDREQSQALAAARAGAQPEDGEGGPGHIREALENVPSPPQVFIYTTSGDLIASSQANRYGAPPTDSLRWIAQHAPSRTHDVGEFRTRSMRTVAGDSIVIIAVSSLHEQHETLRHMLTAFVLAILLALLLAGLAGYGLAGRSLAPVIAATEQQRRFMAEAAHELRTPVAILRAETGVALSRNTRSEEEYRSSLHLLHDESARLSRIIEDLFLIARADAGHIPLRPQSTLMNEVLDDVVKSVAPLAAARNISLELLPQDQVRLDVDPQLLRRLVLNLLDNAIKYAPPGAHVHVAMNCSQSECQVSVDDDGPSIDPATRERVFERFFRAPTNASDIEAGAGLGLAIARWIAEAHHGTLELTIPRDGGNKFTVRLPREI